MRKTENSAILKAPHPKPAPKNRDASEDQIDALYSEANGELRSALNAIWRKILPKDLQHLRKMQSSDRGSPYTRNSAWKEAPNSLIPLFQNALKAREEYCAASEP